MCATVTVGDCIQLQAMLTLGKPIHAPFGGLPDAKCLADASDAIDGYLNGLNQHAGGLDALRGQLQETRDNIDELREAICRQQIQEPEAGEIYNETCVLIDRAIRLIRMPHLGAQMQGGQHGIVARTIDTLQACRQPRDNLSDYVGDGLSDDELDLTEDSAAGCIADIAVFVDAHFEGDPDKDGLIDSLDGLEQALLTDETTALEAREELVKRLYRTVGRLRQAVLDFFLLGDYDPRLVDAIFRLTHRQTTDEFAKLEPAEQESERRALLQEIGRFASKFRGLPPMPANPGNVTTELSKWIGNLDEANPQRQTLAVFIALVAGHDPVLFQVALEHTKVGSHDPGKVKERKEGYRAELQQRRLWPEALRESFRSLGDSESQGGRGAVRYELELVRSLWRERRKPVGVSGDPGARINYAGRVFREIVRYTWPRSADDPQKLGARLNRAAGPASLALGILDALNEEVKAWADLGMFPMPLEYGVFIVWEFLRGDQALSDMKDALPEKRPRRLTGKKGRKSGISVLPLFDDEAKVPEIRDHHWECRDFLLQENNGFDDQLVALLIGANNHIARFRDVEDLRLHLLPHFLPEVALLNGREDYATDQLRAIETCRNACALHQQTGPFLDYLEDFFTLEDRSTARDCIDAFKALSSACPCELQGEQIKRAMRIVEDSLKKRRKEELLDSMPRIEWLLSARTHTLDEARSQRMKRELRIFAGKAGYWIDDFRRHLEQLRKQAAQGAVASIFRASMDQLCEDLDLHLRRLSDSYELQQSLNRGINTQERARLRWRLRRILRRVEIELPVLLNAIAAGRSWAVQLDDRELKGAIGELQLVLRKATHSVLDLALGAFDTKEKHRGLAKILRFHLKRGDLQWVEDTLERK